MNNSAIIKWSGSKRSQAEEIVSYFPRKIKTYYEPFIGSGSILYQLLNEIKNGNIKVDKIVVNDINKDLMDIWKCIYNNPDKIFSYYVKNYNIISSLATVKEQQDFYNSEREKFNKNHTDNTDIFYWLTRTCYNGLVRYNLKGEYNTPFHLNRLGMKPEKLEKIFNDWKELFSGIDIEFKCEDYKKTLINIEADDFTYLDPPYENTNSLMYFSEGFNNKEFIEEVTRLTNNDIKWIMSYDGKHGNESLISNVPETIYKNHILLNSGNSSFSRLNKKDIEVYESLYINI